MGIRHVALGLIGGIASMYFHASQSFATAGMLLFVILGSFTCGLAANLK